VQLDLIDQFRVNY